MTKLSDYLSERARIDGLSNRAFARRCDIAPTTANRLLAGTAKPDRETLEKVAANLPAPLDKLLELAGIEERQPFLLPAEADLLEPDERRTVVRVVRQILRSSGRLDRTDDDGSDDE
jgi:transcriptional regulator with XRE-family HTH domain